LFFVFLLVFWPSLKLPNRFISQFETPQTVFSRPIFIESYPPDGAWFGEYSCTKTTIYATNALGLKERVFSDDSYVGDELRLLVLSPNRMYAVGEFINQTCGGKDQKYSYFDLIDFTTGKSYRIADKKNSILAYSSNITFSPNNKFIAYFDKDTIHLFDIRTRLSKVITQFDHVQPAAIFDTNEQAQQSEVDHQQKYVTFTLNNGKWIYEPRRNLAWKDSTTLYYYVDLFHEEDGFYSLHVENGQTAKLQDFTYEDFTQLKKQNSKHQLGITGYPLEDLTEYQEYKRTYCTEGKSYTFCQI
jgi:hypothetical protein